MQKIWEKSVNVFVQKGVPLNAKKKKIYKWYGVGFTNI